MSLLEKKISSELLSSENILGPIRLGINKQMGVYGDTDFRDYIMKKSIYFALDHAVHLYEEDRLALYRLLKLNT